jgi:predicted protein tyrosine phosphatase
MKNVLFVCSQNLLRSPTAEDVFASWPGVDTASAGLNHDAATKVTPELIQWADIIFVMERVHRRKLTSKFRTYLRNKQVICLDIPDDFQFMDPELVKILRERVPKFF